MIEFIQSHWFWVLCAVVAIIGIAYNLVSPPRGHA